jgi:mannose-6-phosphate isomerase-like protein (cupin superfamily)
VTCGAESIVVGPFDTVHVPPQAVHGVENTGIGDLTFIVVTSPPDDLPR